jgi:hypothetical protein
MNHIWFRIGEVYRNWRDCQPFWNVMAAAAMLLLLLAVVFA